MNIAIFINTPAQAHFFKNIIGLLLKKGHNVKVLARNYGETLNLLNAFHIPHSVYANVSESKYGKILFLPLHILTAYGHLRRFHSDLIVGTGIYSVYAALLLRTPNILFIDAVSTKAELALAKPFIQAVVTPSNLPEDLGAKHIRIDSFKELSYLHPKYFTPDHSILDLLQVRADERFVLLRFNAFDTTHDFGIGGFTITEKRALIEALKEYGKVFISSERPLPPDLEPYSLKIPRERIHDVLCHATLLIADTGTMITEAALLGTPAIMYHPRARSIGNFIELENKYGLIRTYEDGGELIRGALELLSRDGLREEWKEKRELLGREKIDIAGFFVWFLESFPDSFHAMRNDPSCQARFM